MGLLRSGATAALTDFNTDRLEILFFGRGKRMSSGIELRHIDKSYKRGRESVEVLKRLNLDIAAGDFLALMGPSGSGKTTLLNLISGLDRANQGEIKVNGRYINRLSGDELAEWRA